MTTKNEALAVYQAISEITAEMAKEGISKNRRNQQQGYQFRGIEDVYAALSPKLAAHKLCILPRVTDRQVIERQTQRGGTLFYTTLTVEFDFVSAVDGSRHTICTVGEAMDSADKSSNKAMSAAYKYAAFLTFAIPVEGDNDADATTHEVAPKQPAQQSEHTFTHHLSAISSATALEPLQAAFAAAWRSSLPDKDKADLKAAYEQKKAELQKPGNLADGFVPPDFESMNDTMEIGHEHGGS